MSNFSQGNTWWKLNRGNNIKKARSFRNNKVKFELTFMGIWKRTKKNWLSY